MKIVGACDLKLSKLEKFAGINDIEESKTFQNWRDVFAVDKFADAVLITLTDQFHFEVATTALDQGYHVLLEKPMATNPEQIIALVEKEQESDGLLQICHVLRYTEFYKKVKEMIDNGSIGKIVNIEISENVAYYHYAHSFIRGNWHNRADTGPFILTKSSHDLDLLYWFTHELPSKLSSFGSQQHFGKANKPDGAPNRCLDGCPVEATCLYSAPRLYLDILPLLHAQMKKGSKFDKAMIKLGLKYPKLQEFPGFRQMKQYTGWPIHILTETPGDIESRIDALENGPYGRCVYDIEDHDLVDQQVVSLTFPSGVNAVFSLHGHSSEERRRIRIDGTKGTIEGRFSFVGNFLEYTNSLSGEREILIDGVEEGRHGGGDFALLQDFLDNISTSTTPMTNGETSAISHLLAFAADKARKQECVVNFKEYLRDIGYTNIADN